MNELKKEGEFWLEYWISQDAGNNGYSISKVDPNIAPVEYFLGILGIPGITAYVGLFRIGELREIGTRCLFHLQLVE